MHILIAYNTFVECSIKPLEYSKYSEMLFFAVDDNF